MTFHFQEETNDAFYEEEIQQSINETEDDNDSGKIAVFIYADMINKLTPFKIQSLVINFAT